ncbi:MAG: hypothetical protein U0640_13650 [Phycisphaerales bacterium]
MDLQTTLLDKHLKAKAKVEAIAKMLLDGKIAVGELIRVAEGSKDKDKATCIEALEFATRARPDIASSGCLDFVTGALLDEAPRVKWESAKVVRNIAHRFPARLADAIKNLLANSEHPGTVVRWSAAGALGAIVELGTTHNRDLVPAIEGRLERGDDDQAIRKIYQAALKKVARAAPAERPPARRRPRP